MHIVRMFISQKEFVVKIEINNRFSVAQFIISKLKIMQFL